ncbi:endospore germination permease [Bacillus sp. BRMEA1]|uniref:GerAB/ArcD/ProY family transporter n=1 Tax=Neobacillus endophyticus TaxID=2738405 RepID=UPI001565FBD1|nr:endospore germination permease [Neobacillus endophyticus]NRD77001.1 endospore germination permease [Neobacillus endophyticus]
MKISGTQIFWMLFTLEVGNSLLLTISSTIRVAKQDAWISMMIAGIAGIAISLLATSVSSLYPGQTIIEYSQTILGKWPGKLIMIPFFIQWYSVIGLIVREFGDFIITALFQQTPLWVIVFTVMLLLVLIIYQGGIEGIGRLSEIVGPMVLLMVTVLIFLDIKDMDWHQMLPIYQDSGLSVILKASYTPMASFFGESVMMTMFVYFMDQPNQASSRAMWGIGTAVFMVTIGTLAVIFTFGPALPSSLLYPFYELSRYISVMEFIQNVDILIVIIWYFSIFVKLALYMFIASYGTAQWFHLKDWRKVAWFLAPISFIVAMSIKNINIFAQYYDKFFWLPYVFPINMIGIPLLLLIVGWVRKKYAMTS